MKKLNIEVANEILGSINNYNSVSQAAESVFMSRQTFYRKLSYLNDLFGITILDEDEFKLTTEGLYILKELEKVNITLSSLTKRDEDINIDIAIIYDTYISKKFNKINYLKILELIEQFNAKKLNNIVVSKYADNLIKYKSREFFKAYPIYMVGNKSAPCVVRNEENCLYKHLSECDYKVDILHDSFASILNRILKEEISFLTLFPESFDDFDVKITKLDLPTIEFYKYYSK